MNLDFDNIDQLFENSLNDLELKPSGQVKTQIQKKMFWHNTFKNTYFRISLALLLLLTIAGSSFLLKNSQENKNTEINQTNTSVIANTIRKEQTKNNSEILESQTTAIATPTNTVTIIKGSSDLENKNSKINKLNIKQLKESESKILDKADLIKHNTIPAVKETAIPTSSTKIAQDKTINQSESVIVSEETKSNNQQVLPTDDYQQKESFGNSSIALLEARINFTLWGIPYPNLNDYPLQDDTVGINIHGQEIILPSNRWNLGAYIRPNYSISRFNNTNASESQDISKINSDAYNPDYSYGFGLELSYQFKQLSLGGGLAYSQYTQDFNTIDKSLETQEIDFWTYSDMENWNVTNTSYLNLDSLLQGDTVMTVITDSTKYITQDSTLNTRTDSAWTEKAFAYKNMYQYFEIPLFIEYSFSRSKKWQPFMRVGLVTGIHIKSQAYYTDANGKVFDASVMPFAKFNFWAHFGLGLKYNLNKKISTSISMSYRYNLNAIVKDESNFNQNLDNLGVTISLQYHF